MALIDRIGRFRGVPTQGIMGQSTGGFPQFVVQFLATEYYHETITETGEKHGEWIDWSPYQQTMTAYLILFNDSKALLNYEQVMKAFKWDGADLGALQADDFGDLIVQFEVKENVYNGKINLRIEWVDAADANPTSGGGGNLTPMDTGKLKAMSAKYGQFMKTKAAIAPVRGGLPTPPPVVDPSGTRSGHTPLPLPTPVAPASAGSSAVEGITQQAAWAGLNEANATLTETLTEDALGTVFLTSTDAVAAVVGRSEIELTEADWASVLANATIAIGA